MRHLWSLLSGIAATAAAMSWSALNLDGAGRWWFLARLVGIGLILGLVATLRISPVGPVVAGLALLTPLTIFMADFAAFHHIFYSGYEADVLGLRLLSSEVGDNFGIFGVIGSMMIVAAISRQRWQVWPKQVDALVDNGPVGGVLSRPLDDALPSPAGANDGTTEQLWVQPR